MVFLRKPGAMRAALGVAALTAALCAASAPAEENLCFNGDFDHPEDPLAGWTANYEWMGNEHFMDNHTRVSVVPREGVRRQVLRIRATQKTRIESKPIPYEQGARYRCTFDLKGGTARVYLAGYKWKPGVRPHEDPHLGRLRTIYKGTPFFGSGGRSWSTHAVEIPMENPSRAALRHLKYVRFIAVFVMASRGDVFIDNVNVTRIQ